MSLNAITRMYDPKEQNPVFFFVFNSEFPAHRTVEKISESKIKQIMTISK